MELKRNKGFTLAEVLITLVIIGVIAAITIPVLMANWREQATVAQVKKIYSTIAQAQKRAIATEGTGVAGWKYTTEAELFSFFKPYLRIMKDCGNDTSKECSAKNQVVKYLNGTPSTANYSDRYRFILDDGSSLWFQIATQYGEEPCTATNGGKENVCGYFMFDTNGVKDPNTLGKDTFSFYLFDNNLTPCPNDDCYLSAKGWGCAGHILKYGNMKYPK